MLTRTKNQWDEVGLLRWAVDAVKTGIWEWNLENDSATWDERMHQIYGVESGSFQGGVESWRKHCHPEDVERASEDLQAAIRGERDYRSEFRIINPNGATKTIKGLGLVIRNEHGIAVRMFGINQDITEEKNTLRSMEKLKAYFEGALAQSPAGIVIADAPDGKLSFANPSSLKIAGGDEAQLVANVAIDQYDRWNITDLENVPIPNNALPLARAVKLGESSTKKIIFVRPGGEKRVALAQTGPVRSDAGKILSGITVFVDITEQHRLMEELSAAREVAEVAMRAKAKFLDIAAHELRTPVTAASLLVQLTQRNLEKDKQVDKGILHRLRIQLDRLSRLVVDLLEVSKLDRGVLQLRYECTDFKSLIRDCISTFSMQFPERKFNFFSPDQAVDVQMDPIRVSEVISNLIDNAIKFSPKESPVDVELVDSPEWIRCSVRDHGPGLSEEGQEKLFTAFERGDASEKAPGLGLGLFICRGIVNLHGGSIGVKSSAGKGSAFYFDLPKTHVMRQTAS